MLMVVKFVFQENSFAENCLDDFAFGVRWSKIFTKKTVSFESLRFSQYTPMGVKLVSRHSAEGGLAGFREILLGVQNLGRTPSSSLGLLLSILGS